MQYSWLAVQIMPPGMISYVDMIFPSWPPLHSSTPSVMINYKHCHVRRLFRGVLEQLLSQKLSREIVSRIQKLRKKAGLQVGEVVEVR